MDINIAITRAGIFSVVYALVLGIPFWLGYITKSWFISTFLMFILATLGPFIYAYLRRQAENQILKEDLKAYNTLTRLIRNLPLIRELDKILKLIVYRLVKTLKISYAGIYLFDAETGSYILRSKYNMRDIRPEFPNELPSEGDFVKFITKWHREFLYEDLQRLNIDVSGVASQMKQMIISLVLPHFLEDNLIGFMVLGPKSTGRNYSEKDVQVLSSLAETAGLQITNALFAIELRNTEQELSETHRVAQMGYLASSIGHQVNNILNNIAAISAGLQCNEEIAPLFTDKPELKALFDKHINDILTNVEDGGMIIRELRDYAQSEQDKQFTLVNLKDVVDKTLKILYIPANKFQTIDMSINISPDVPNILGSFVQLQNVLINLCNNAYDAVILKRNHIKDHPELGITGYKGRIEINISRQKNKAHIHITDDGLGIPKDVQKRLFTPLYTTKGSYDKRKEQKLSGGTGIGLYTILIIIKNHDGSIKLVKTEHLQGSDFLVELPIPKEGD